MNIFSNLLFIDQAVTFGLVNFRTNFWDSFFGLVTNFGDYRLIIIFLLIISLLFYFCGKKKIILPFLLTFIGSSIMTLLIKFLVDRARPGIDVALYLEKLPSFPSAHSALVFAFFGFFLYCVWKFKINLFLKIILALISISIIILVGFSRLYLGVHFLSDVIAGYLVGLMWVLISMYFSRKRF